MGLEGLPNKKPVAQEGAKLGELEKAIATVESFSQLYAALDKVGPIQGSQELFQPGQLKSIIEKVRAKSLPIEAVTRTHGLRDKVESLLEELERRPDAPTPPPLQASVKLELPIEEKGNLPQEDHRPEVPPLPTQEASVKLELPKVDEKKTDEASKETSPTSPFSPFTDEEKQFIDKAENDYMFMEGFDQGDTERRNRYDQLMERSQQLKEITNPASFESFHAALMSVREIAGTDSNELWEIIEEVREGRAPLDSLPEMVRQAVQGLVVREVFDKLYQSKHAAIDKNEWAIFLEARPYNEHYYVKFEGKENIFPKVGDTGLHTEEGVIDGKLAWCDGEQAIFETSSGDFMIVPFNKIILGDGKSLEQRTQSANEARREKPSLKARRIVE